MNRPFRIILAMALWGAALTGCTPRSPLGGFDSDNPESRLYAINRAGVNRDVSAVPKLVGCLDDDDPAVRMMAIIALERITGSRLGYNPYVSPPNRLAAIQRWNAAVRSGKWATPEHPGS